MGALTSAPVLFAFGRLKRLLYLTFSPCGDDRIPFHNFANLSAIFGDHKIKCR